MNQSVRFVNVCILDAFPDSHANTFQAARLLSFKVLTKFR